MKSPVYKRNLFIATVFLALTACATQSDEKPTRKAPYPSPGPLYSFSESESWGFIDSTGRKILSIPHQANAIPLSTGILVHQNNKAFILNWGNDTIWQMDSVISIQSKVADRIILHKSSPNVHLLLDAQGKIICEREVNGEMVRLKIPPPLYPAEMKSAGDICFWNEGMHDWKQDNGLLPVNNSTGRWSYVNINQNVVIPFQYLSAEPFHEGVARVQYARDSYGFINLTGNPLTADRYQSASDFRDGYATVKTQNGWKQIDKMGTVLKSLPPDVLYCAPAGAGKMLFKNQSGYGYFDLQGGIVIQPVFDLAHPFENGRASVVDSTHRACWITPEGKVIWRDSSKVN